MVPTDTMGGVWLQYYWDRLERGPGIALQAMQEKKALSSWQGILEIEASPGQAWSESSDSLAVALC